MRLALVVSLALAGGALADSPSGRPPGTPASRHAIALCEAAGEAPEAEQLARFTEALAAAESAVAAQDDDALAHFAVFCSLGGKMQRQGIGPSALLGLRRLRREVDRTLALAPDFSDALAGKGALLLDSPVLLGGDPAGGERLLRRALEVEPDYLGPRFDLVRALRERGARDEARREAKRALAIARDKNDPEDLARARALLDEIEASAPDGG